MDWRKQLQILRNSNRKFSKINVFLGMKIKILSFLLIVFMASCSEDLPEYVSGSIEIESTNLIENNQLLFNLGVEIDENDFPNYEFIIVKWYRINEGEWNGTLQETVSTNSGSHSHIWDLTTISNELQPGDFVYFKYALDYRTGVDELVVLDETDVLYFQVE